MYKKFQFVATTYAGLEQVLAEELIALGADEVEEARRSVYFSGSLELMYKANYSLRTALKILMPLRTFRIKRVDDLYHQAGKIRWEDFFDARQTFAVQSKVFSDLFRNSMFASLKVKDAIVDRFRRVESRRPSVNINRPDILVNLHVANDQCTISLDSSGESLHKRGYRSGVHEAPISEVLAAGMIKLSGWNGSESLTDPMCGSGTIVIEAAMIAKNILPGEFRRKYSFQNWKNFEKEAFIQLKDQKEYRNPGIKIYGSDIARENIDLAYKNAEKANVSDIVQLDIADFRTLEKRSDSSFLLFNPPYGERIKTGDQAFYSMIGERLKHHYPETSVWVISTNECLKSIGLKPELKIPLFNGSLACSFREYKLYKGSRKTDK
ncbi:class I SAM-dependent RNA methyltransferase [Sunxiuqinia elliptica]|uniref:Putative N6-adenine-specific DNA methylase n=1 Tax=Sunxiuqinia elliptica TaxID=655355 RepID=A0A4R6GRW0_9BACT|nr:THUMP domain-containing protein [Sunxiuqinia elliptica]TDN97285.1 putative N6-adenine-specific DNA methylase [Sunxiuqinia elliptica]TDO60532.1 putative N6-adenine-specific DNA methylase [Sunxiuqinia elliptica]